MFRTDNPRHRTIVTGVGEATLAAVFRAVASFDAPEHELLRLETEARRAWPDLAVPTEAFVAHLARHVGSLAALATVHVADLFLAFAVASHDRAALSIFEERYLSHVPDYVVRVRAGKHTVDEIVQKVREALVLGAEGKSPKILEYSGKGPLGGWLRVVASRTALNHVRASGPKTESLGDDATFSGDPELAYVKEHTQALFQDAFRRVLAGLDANGRTILRLHYIEGLTMDQLSVLYKTPRSTIARRVAEARTAVLEATESLLRDEKRLSPSSIASVLRLAQSRLDVTMSRLLE